MRHTFAKLALFAPALAVAAGCSAVNASSEVPGEVSGDEPGDARAISLNVIEEAGTVEIQVIANSQVAQQVEFTAELSGASNSRHHSNTSLAAGNRQVLSRMKIAGSDTWCAKVDVSESSGASYTLNAGDCTSL